MGNPNLCLGFGYQRSKIRRRSDLLKINSALHTSIYYLEKNSSILVVEYCSKYHFSYFYPKESPEWLTQLPTRGELISDISVIQAPGNEK